MFIHKYAIRTRYAIMIIPYNHVFCAQFVTWNIKWEYAHTVSAMIRSLKLPTAKKTYINRVPMVKVCCVVTRHMRCWFWPHICRGIIRPLSIWQRLEMIEFEFIYFYCTLLNWMWSILIRFERIVSDSETTEIKSCRQYCYCFDYPAWNVCWKLLLFAHYWPVDLLHVFGWGGCTCVRYIANRFGFPERSVITLPVDGKCWSGHNIE